MSVGGSDNANGNDDNIIFTIKDTKLYVSARDNQKLSKLHSKGFERSICWNEDKTKSDNKNTTNEFKYCLELNFLRGNRPFVLVYWNEDAASKRFKAKRYYLPKQIINNYHIIIIRKNFYNQPIGSDTKRWKKFRNLAKGQGEDCTTRYLLGYDYIENHYRLIAVDLSKQKELDADPRSIQQVDFVEQTKN